MPSCWQSHTSRLVLASASGACCAAAAASHVLAGASAEAAELQLHPLSLTSVWARRCCFDLIMLPAMCLHASGLLSLPGIASS